MKYIVLALAVVGCGEVSSSDSRDCRHFESAYSHTSIECDDEQGIFNKSVVLCDSVNGYIFRPGCVDVSDVQALLTMPGCHTKNWCFDEY